VEFVNVDESTGKQGEEQTEVPRPTVYALSVVRPLACGVPQVQGLSHLLQDLGERRQNPGSEKGKLVIPGRADRPQPLR
jgi:hypothetical protein